MKVVLDTNVLLVSISPRSRHRWVLDALLDQRFTLCVTTEILLEYGEIVGQHMGERYFQETMKLLENLNNLELVTPRFHFNLLADPDDNKFVDCAIAANAVCIVSHDRDFLPLREIEFPKVAVVDEVGCYAVMKTTLFIVLLEMEKIEKYSKEIDVAFLRSVFGAVPFVGGALNEVIFDIRGRVKQERLNKFVELLEEFFKSKSDFNVDALKSEDFGDLFEEVVKRVVQTKSTAKHKRYRDILVSGAEANLLGVENASRFLDLVSSLEEVEIIILSNYAEYGSEVFKVSEELNSLENHVSSLNQQMKEELRLSAAGSANDRVKVIQELDSAKIRLQVLREKKSKLKAFVNYSHYNLSQGKFIFYKQSLCSKALLVDVGARKHDYQPYEDVQITAFGMDFVFFLKS